MKMHGYRNIVQLSGGIINYLRYQNEKKIKNYWNGECFVFDDRVTINENLTKGKYLQCYGCRRPITKIDTKNKYYLKGVYCPYCYKKRTYEQKRNSLNRQKQIDSGEFKKI